MQNSLMDFDAFNIQLCLAILLESVPQLLEMD